MNFAVLKWDLLLAFTIKGSTWSVLATLPIKLCYKLDVLSTV